MRLENKTVLVTGATSGIGEVTAVELARLGARVLVVGRNPERAGWVVKKIVDQGGAAEALTADLTSQAEIRRMAQEVKERVSQLDVLVNNAGAFFNRFQRTPDGLESTFALNHLSYFLLSALLLPLLKKSPSARIVNVSSMAHMTHHLDFGDLQMEKHYSGWTAYGRSKLCNLYFTYELARRLKGSSVTVNALHPGFVATNFGRADNSLVSAVFGLLQLAAKSPQEGARTSIFLAASKAVEGKTGEYYVDCRPVRSSEISYDEGIARKLWSVSEKLTGLG